MADRKELVDTALDRYRAMNTEALVTMARTVDVSVPHHRPSAEIEALLIALADRVEEP